MREKYSNGDYYLICVINESLQIYLRSMLYFVTKVRPLVDNLTCLKKAVVLPIADNKNNQLHLGIKCVLILFGQTIYLFRGNHMRIQHNFHFSNCCMCFEIEVGMGGGGEWAGGCTGAKLV